ncbi:major facilitator superfamily-domain-containing protein [Clohesyomyces aquaticus]|uniref:Major facilitator superfamily-domain-containing protein n=1 Tax=Clohesyomyces aquaticus TaxID=1231657 RepID=A0A1Y1ZW36_9PLEO|nr:major facilitator superfamily-domain-containing protein [Clohesyomyces aquaticus]
MDESKGSQDSGSSNTSLFNPGESARLSKCPTIVQIADSGNLAVPTSQEDKRVSQVTICDPIPDVETLAHLEPPKEWSPTKPEWLIMISLSCISLMVALDATILVTVLPTIATALHGSSIDAFWAGTSYLLTSAVFQPVIASISEVFGRQQMLLWALFLFTVGSILCAIANDFTVLLVGRSVQGIGGGGIVTLGQVIFCDIVPLRQRPKYFAMVLGSWAIGSIIGPVVGGALCERLNWRWLFYLNFPFCFLGFILAIFFVKLNAVAKLTFAQKLKRTDWLGAVLFLGGTTSFLVGLSWGGVQYPWRSAQTLAPILTGLVAIVVFIFWQRKIAPNSLLPMSIFYCRSALAAFYCAMVNGLVLFTGLYYFPFYCMAVLGTSPTTSGIDLFPALFFIMPGSVIVAVITTRLGRFRWAIWAGWSIATFGAGLLILLDLHTKTAVWAVALAVFGMGCGMVLTSVNVAIQAISEVEDAAMAASMYGFMRSLGMPIGTAISGAIFQNAMSAKLNSLGLPAVIAHDSERYVAVLRTMHPNDPVRIGALQAYVYGFRFIWIFMTAVCGTAMAASLLIKKFNMNKRLVSMYSARPESS